MTVQTPIRAEHQVRSLDQMVAYFEPRPSTPAATTTLPANAPREIAVLADMFAYYDGSDA